jgi:hypothetical protein
MSSDQYMTSRGYVIRFKSIPVLIQKLVQQFPMPQPPTYTVQTATGATETHPHNATTLETDADRAAWADYQRALQLRGAEFLNAQIRMCLLEGIEVVSKPAGDWEKRQRLIGLRIPDDPLEKEMHFLETEITASKADVIALIAGVSRMSGIDEEAVSELEDSFRDSVGRKRQNAERIAERNSDAEAGLADGDALRANGNGNRKDEDAAVAVGFTG